MDAIRADQVGKKYKHYRMPTDRIWEWATGGRISRHESNWVLRGIDFAVQSGEAIGIVGPNGAGKSTLLRIIRGTIRASEGEVTTQGRVAALELGLGFHPDFSGYENLEMAGALVGLDAAAVRARRPDIEDFAELGDALNDPVRTYSSGMQMRLAFSIATAVRPSILLIDEALAVGDLYFQHKCMARIRSFREQGTSLILVSHDATAITSLCDRALLIESGTLVRDGSPTEVIELYNALNAKRTESYEIRQGGSLAEEGGSTRSGDRRATIDRVEMLRDGTPSEHFRVGEEMSIRVHGHANQALADLTVGIALRDRLGNEVFGTNTKLLGCEPIRFESGETFCTRFDLPANIGFGSYSLTVALHVGEVHLDGNFDWWDNVCTFQMIPGSGPRFTGTNFLPVQAQFESKPNHVGDNS